MRLLALPPYGAGAVMTSSLESEGEVKPRQSTIRLAGLFLPVIARGSTLRFAALDFRLKPSANVAENKLRLVLCGWHLDYQ